jgi:Arc/MetJ-type ribon-helix-helix transcriptional regulator
MQQKNRMATLAATVRAEIEAKKDQVPRYERFAKADAALASVAPMPLPDDRTTAATVENQENDNNAFDREVKAAEVSGSEISSLRVVRETFSLPPQDSDLIGELRDKCLATGVYVSKSELIRAGLHALNDMPLEDLRARVSAVEKLPVGRAAKSYNRMKRSESMNDT